MRKFVNNQGEMVEIFTEPFRTKTKSSKWVLRFKSPKGDVTLTENNQIYAVLPSELEVIGTADGIVKD